MFRFWGYNANEIILRLVDHWERTSSTKSWQMEESFVSEDRPQVGVD